MDFKSENTKAELERKIQLEVKLAELQEKFRTLREEIEKSPLDESDKKKVLSLNNIYLFDYRLNTAQRYLNAGELDSAKKYLERAKEQLNEIEKKYTHAKGEKREIAEITKSKKENKDEAKKIIEKKEIEEIEKEIRKEREWEIALNILRSFRDKYSELDNYIKLYEAAPSNLKHHYKDFIKKFIADKEEIKKKINEDIRRQAEEIAREREVARAYEQAYKSAAGSEKVRRMIEDINRHARKEKLKTKLRGIYEREPPKTFWKFDISEFMGLLSLSIGVLLTFTGWLGGWFVGLPLIVVGIIFAPWGRLELKHHLGLISLVAGIIIALYVHFWVGVALATLGFGLLVGDIASENRVLRSLFGPVANIMKYFAAIALLFLVFPYFINWIGIEIHAEVLIFLTIVNSILLYIFWGFEEGKSVKESIQKELLEEELKLAREEREWLMKQKRMIKTGAQKIGGKIKKGVKRLRRSQEEIVEENESE